VTNPTLPAMIGAVVEDDVPTGVNGTAKAPSFSRSDLVTVFLTGIPTVNQLATVTPSEILRLNTGLKAVPYADQSPLGLVGGIIKAGGVSAAVAGQSTLDSNGKVSDLAGFPNGRRPKDDVVDIALVAAMGGLCTQAATNLGLGAPVFGTNCTPANVPLGNAVLQITDKADQELVPLLNRFPYLNTPLGGTRVIIN